MSRWPYRYQNEGGKVVRVPVIPEGAVPHPEGSDPDSLAPPASFQELARAVDDLVVVAQGVAQVARGFAARLWQQAYRARLLERAAGNPGGRGPEREVEPRSDVRPEDIRDARKVAGLSQRRLAEKLKFSRSLVAEVEREQRSVPQTLGDWAKETLCSEDRGAPDEAG